LRYITTCIPFTLSGFEEREREREKERKKERKREGEQKERMYASGCVDAISFNVILTQLRFKKRVLET